MLIDTPLSIDRGEVTDKGSINQRAVLEHRAALIERLYSPVPGAEVITADEITTDLPGREPCS
jgi:feruloyl-CoA synthase